MIEDTLRNLMDGTELHGRAKGAFGALRAFYGEDKLHQLALNLGLPSNPMTANDDELNAFIDKAYKLLETAASIHRTAMTAGQAYMDAGKRVVNTFVDDEQRAAALKMVLDQEGVDEDEDLALNAIFKRDDEVDLPPEIIEAIKGVFASALGEGAEVNVTVL